MSTPAAPPASKKRVVSPEKWADIEAAWKQGKFATVADLANSFKVPAKTVENRFAKMKIKRGSAIEDYDRRLAKEMEAKAVRDAKLLGERIEETRNEHYVASHGLFKLTWSEITTAKQKNLPMASIKGNLQSLELAAKTLKLVREERFAVLGLDREPEKSDDPDELPDLMVSELTEAEMEEMRNASTDLDEDDDAAITQIETAGDEIEDPVDDE